MRKPCPIGPWPFAPDEAHVILATTVMHPTMTCKEMMRMHGKMMGGGGKKMSCKELMRMHKKMMGGKA
jgi:hypothetical protein